MSRIKNIKNPEVFKKRLEEFREGDGVKIKFEKDDKIYKVIKVDLENEWVFLEGREYPIEFKQLEFVSNEAINKLFDKTLETASQAAEVKKTEPTEIKETEKNDEEKIAA